MKVEVSIDSTLPLANGKVTIAIHIAELAVHEVADFNFEMLSGAFGEPGPVTEDLALVGAIVYLVDKAVPRRVAEDFWTREFDIELPVSDPVQWRVAGPDLERCLSFLTGDEWSLGFRIRTERLARGGPTAYDSLPTIQADEVSLFSGGADSLVGTLDELAGDSSKRLGLLGHHDATGPAGDQDRLWRTINGGRYKGRTRLCRVRVRPLPARWAGPSRRVEPAAQGREPTLRSRSFLFLALGLCAAQTLGNDVALLVPENGFIAINIPLTASRVGTCSTRTTHPYYLDSVRSLAKQLGFGNPITNPLEDKTKGEVLAECLDQDLLAALGRESVSCAHPSRRTHWRRRGARNCGYCVPCLIRRAAFHHTGADRGDEYGIDVCADELGLGVSAASDLCAVLDCLDQVRSVSDVETRVLDTGPLGERFRSSVDLVQRGLAELRQLFAERAGPEVQRRAGL